MHKQKFYSYASNYFKQTRFKQDLNKSSIPYADPESFVRGGPTLTKNILVDEGRREDPNNTKSGPPSALQRNAI